MVILKKKQPKLGSEGRFAALKKSIEQKGKNVKDAAAIAASIGIKKYGKEKMAKMAAAARKKKK